MLLWEKLLGEVGFLNFFGVGRNTYIYVCFQSLGENSGSVCCRERRVGFFFFSSGIRTAVMLLCVC